METQEKKEVIAAFDFDGTITTKDTLFDFIAFYVGKGKLILGLFIISPILVLFKVGIIKNSVAKQMMFSYFFKNKNIKDFESKCQQYAQRIDQICRKSTLDKIKEHQALGHRVIVISASVSNWIKPWALTAGIEEVYGTEIGIKDNIISGKFSSENCYGPEKVNRLLTAYPNRDKYVLYAYGDSRGDKELLELADHPTLL